MGKTIRWGLAAGCMVVALAIAAGAAWAGTATQPPAILKAPPAREPVAPATSTTQAPSTGTVVLLAIPGVSGDGPGGKAVCSSFRTGGSVQGHATAGQASVGRTFEEIIITKHIDKASPMLRQAAATGRRLNSVVIEVHQGGPQAEAEGAAKPSKAEGGKYLEIKLTEVLVSSVRQVGGGDRPMEEIAFVPKR